MKINTQLICKLLYVLAWLLLVGLCIEGGAFLTNAFFAWLHPSTVPYLWKELDLSALFRYDRVYFGVMHLLMGLVALLKAALFYAVIHMLHSRRFDMLHPFSRELGRFTTTLSVLALMIGLLSRMGAAYAGWLQYQGATLPNLQELQLDGSDVWLFMSVVLIVVAQLFRRGMELQQENELTV